MRYPYKMRIRQRQQAGTNNFRQPTYEMVELPDIRCFAQPVVALALGERYTEHSNIGTKSRIFVWLSPRDARGLRIGDEVAWVHGQDGVNILPPGTTGTIRNIRPEGGGRVHHVMLDVEVVG